MLDLSGGRIFSINTDGTDVRTLVTGCRHPDGIAIQFAGEGTVQFFSTDYPPGAKSPAEQQADLLRKVINSVDRLGAAGS